MCASFTAQTPNGATMLPSFESCSDMAGLPYIDSDLTIHKEWYDPPRVDFTPPCTGFTNWRYTNCVPHHWSISFSPAHNAVRSALLSVTLDGADAAAVQARSNPSRPVVDIPQFVYELREIPGLLRWMGEQLLSKKGAGAFLAWNFGAAPLISDLIKLADFGSHYEKRKKTIDQLYVSGLSRRIDLSANTQNGSIGPQTIGGSGAHVLVGTTTWVAKQTKWGTIRWSVDTPPPTSDERAILALRSALGLTADLATLWNIVPWTWLVDWFTSAGDYLEAHRNILGATPSSLCLMAHSSVKVIYDITGKPAGATVTGGAGKTHFDRKRRVVGLVPSVVATLPFLSAGQLGILTSLAIMKTPRRTLAALGAL